MGWVPICDGNGNGNPFDCIALHLAVAIAVTPNMNSCDDAVVVAVAVAQCERTLKMVNLSPLILIYPIMLRKETRKSTDW